MHRTASLLFLAGAFPFFAGLTDSNGPAQQRDDKKDKAARSDLEKLQGAWYHASREVGGKQIVGEVRDSLIVFRGDVVILKKGTNVSQVGAIRNTDATANPKRFDMVITDGPNEGMTILAIYEVNDELFRYCGGVESRPSSFRTQVDDKGYVYCSTYKRVKR